MPLVRTRAARSTWTACPRTPCPVRGKSTLMDDNYETVRPYSLAFGYASDGH